jgi:hypothetical protein
MPVIGRCGITCSSILRLAPAYTHELSLEQSRQHDIDLKGALFANFSKMVWLRFHIVGHYLDAFLYPLPFASFRAQRTRVQNSDWKRWSRADPEVKVLGDEKQNEHPNQRGR